MKAAQIMDIINSVPRKDETYIDISATFKDESLTSVQVTRLYHVKEKKEAEHDTVWVGDIPYWINKIYVVDDDK